MTANPNRNSNLIGFFLILALAFHADKVVTGPYALVRVHDTFDSEFSRYKATGELLFQFGLFGWYPNLAGGIPSYASTFAPYYPSCLLSIFLPLWLIYSLQVITLMFIAGYGLYRFLLDFLRLPQNVSIAGGAVFALNTQNWIVGEVFSYAFPLFFTWTTGLFCRNYASLLFPILGIVAITLFSYPVLTFPFFSLLHLLVILFLNTEHKEKTRAMLIQWGFLWAGYILIFSPQLYALFQYSSVAARTYFPHTRGLLFYLMDFGTVTSIGSLTLFFLGGACFLLFQASLVRRALLISTFLLLVSSFFYSRASNFLLGTFLAKMDLGHFSFTLNFIITVTAFTAVHAACLDKRSLKLFLIGGAMALLTSAGYIYRYIPSYSPVWLTNVLVGFGVLSYCCKDLLISSMKARC